MPNPPTAFIIQQTFLNISFLPIIKSFILLHSLSLFCPTLCQKLFAAKMCLGTKIHNFHSIVILTRNIINYSHIQVTQYNSLYPFLQHSPLVSNHSKIFLFLLHVYHYTAHTHLQPCKFKFYTQNL